MTTRLSRLWANNRWWVVRLGLLPVHLFLFVIVTFFLVRLVPGDPVYITAGYDIDDATYAKVQAALGLDGSLWQQFMTYLGRLGRLDFGNTLVSGQPVWDDIAARFPATLELALMGTITITITSLVASYLIVLHPSNPISAALRGYAKAAGSIPEFVLAVIFIWLFYATLHWAPAPLGRVNAGLALPDKVTGLPFLDALIGGNFAVVGSEAQHLVLPLLVMVIAGAALPTKMLSASLEKQLDSPPTRFRIASGAPRFVVLTSMYRRAIPSYVLVIGGAFGATLGGVVLLERLFGFAGMGQLAIDAVNSSDFVSMQAIMMLTAFVTLLVFLAVDIVNMLIDPRRRPGVAMEA
jgi:peptide/nickel transport system permease protein